jgi:hypothetical protein
MRTVLLVLTTVLLFVAPGSGQPAPALEYRVKAAFLLNFAKFVEWEEPDAAESPVFICVLGEDPLGVALDQVVKNETVGTRPIVVQRITKPGEERCHVAFISKSEKDVRRTLEAVGHGVLTVGEEDSFLRDGGMIAFVIDNRRVRFDVSQPAARNGSIRLSSRLLSVARSVVK